MNDFLIVIVTYNPDVTFLKNNIFDQYNYLIIDNTPNGSLKLETVKNHSSVEILYNYQNLGIAKALNQGLKKAKELGFSYCFLFDQDSTISNDFEEKMKNAYFSTNNNENIAVLGANFCDFSKIINPVNEKDRLNNKCNKQKDVITSGSLININIWEKIGGFDDKLFIDMVDNEYCLRARKAGYYIMITKDVLMFHNLGNPEKKTFWGFSFVLSNHNPKRRYYIFRNYLYCAFKYLTFDPSWSCKIFFSVLPKLFIKACIFEKRKKENLIWILLGIKDLIFRKWDRKVL